MKRLLLAVLALSLPALCAAEKYDWETGIIEGYALPAAGSDKSYKPSPILGAYAGYAISDNFSAGFEMTRYFELGSRYSRGRMMKLLAFEPYVKIRKEFEKGKHKIIPFVVLSAGLCNYRDDNVYDEGGNQIYAGASGTKSSYSAGAGIAYEVSDNWQAGLEARWNYVNRSTGAFNSINPSLRVSYLF